MAQYQIGNAVYELPDNISPEQLQSVVGQLTAGSGPSDPASFGERYMHGAVEPIKGLAAMVGTPSVDELGNQIPGGGASAAEVSQNLKADEAKFQQREPKGFDWARLLGEMTSPVNVALGAMSGGNGLLARLLTGAATGATSGGLTEAGKGGDNGDIGLASAIGGGIGAGVGAAAGAIGAGPSQDVRTLYNNGVRNMTPGQLAGGMVKNLEDKATSIPIVGDVINSARTATVHQFDAATANQVLSSLGQRLPSGVKGNELVSTVEDAISNAYDHAIPQAGIQIDGNFIVNLAQKVSPMLKAAGQDAQQRFDDIIGDVFGRATPNAAKTAATLTGDQFKTIESDLRSQIQTLISNGSTASEKQIGRALIQVKQALQDTLTQQNPQAGEALANANTAWAKFVQLRNAAARDPGGRGVFTPRQLLGAEKAVDKSTGKGAFAKGQMPMQDLASAGQAVLPSSVPDSGTTGRLLAFDALRNPAAWVGTVPAALAYSPPVLRMLNFLAARGLGSTPFANVVSSTAPAAGIAANNLNTAGQ